MRTALKFLLVAIPTLLIIKYVGTDSWRWSSVVAVTVATVGLLTDDIRARARVAPKGRRRSRQPPV